MLAASTWTIFSSYLTVIVHCCTESPGVLYYTRKRKARPPSQFSQARSADSDISPPIAPILPSPRIRRRKPHESMLFYIVSPFFRIYRRTQLNDHPNFIAVAYGLLLLRSTPMVLSAAAVQFYYSQYLFWRPFLDLPGDLQDKGKIASQEGRAQVNTLLGHFIHRQFPAGLAAIFVLYPLTWVVAGANLALSRPTSRLASLLGLSGTSDIVLAPGARYLYTAGLVFSVGHMLFGPRAKNLMETIGGLGEKANGERKRENLYLIQTWLQLHVTRTFFADVPGWLCFTAAFLLSVRLR